MKQDGNKIYVTESEVRQIVREALFDFSQTLNKKDNVITEMARVGFMHGETYEVSVYTRDPGKIPHVHIVDTDTYGKKLNCCVMLETNRYFSHGHHQGELNAKLRKEFNDFMKQRSPIPQFKNNYQLAVAMWNLNNSDTYIQIKEDENGNIIMPDYTNILPYK
jgi:hypothetical protein